MAGRMGGEVWWGRLLVLGGSIVVMAASAAVAWREFAPARAPKPLDDSTWNAIISSGHRIGPSAPRVTVVEFTDFECPACKATAPLLLGVQRARPADVALVIKHFPLERRHPSARAAAVAAICAAANGRFEEFQDAAFRAQDTLALIDWNDIPGGQTPEQVQRAAQCRNSPQTTRMLERDMQHGERVGVRGTPHLLINGTLFVGPLTEAGLDKAVRDALEQAR